MKAEFVSSYDKKLKYRIYDVNGNKRRLLTKGKFKNNAQADFTPNGGEIIVRVSKANTLFFAFFIWLFNLFMVNELEMTKVNWFYEIRVSCGNCCAPLIFGFDNLEGAHGDTVSIFDYDNPSPIRLCTPLYCSNSPFTAIFDKNRAVNRGFIIFTAVSIIAIVFALIPFV